MTPAEHYAAAEKLIDSATVEDGLIAAYNGVENVLVAALVHATLAQAPPAPTAVRPKPVDLPAEDGPSWIDLPESEIS